jgi:hypothetical protein
MDCEALCQVEEGAAPESRLDVDEISPSIHRTHIIRLTAGIVGLGSI